MYFSDRELGPRPQVEEEISQRAWGGMVATINRRVADGSFGYYYPDDCPDGEGVCGCNEYILSKALEAEIPDITWPLDPDNVPPTLTVLDVLEFCHRAVGEPIKLKFHSFFNHHHLDFDHEKGQAIFREDINRIFSRNGLAYELCSDGYIKRLAPEVLRDDIKSAVFFTGDDKLNQLLNDAIAKYLDPDLKVRQESLEKLWDAWERLKTIEPGIDKKASVRVLLDRVANEPTFRDTIEREAKELTRIGNTFEIRHSETDKAPLKKSEYVDYLFHRLFAFIRLVLKTTKRSK